MSNKRARIVSAFEEELTSTVKMVLSHLDSEAVARIVSHLMSDGVGATCMADLQFVTADMLPSSLVPPIKAIQLLRYFSAPGPSGSQAQGSNQQAPERPTVASRSAGESSGSSVGFRFTVNWSSLPKDTVDKLTIKEQSKTRASQDEINTLKLAIVKKLVSCYNDYKDLHPGQKKHPGKKVYASITSQVFERFPFSMADVVNGKVVGDGRAGFQRLLLVCTENQMRQKNAPRSIPNAIQARGVVGVLEEQYLPVLNVQERETQQSLREELQEYFETDMDNWVWDEIKEKMLASYELQRDDIATAKVAIEEAIENAGKNQNNNDNGDGDADEPNCKVLAELKEVWPYLFTVSGLTWHHDRLTGRDLKAHLHDFLDNHLEYLLHFLTKCSKSNKKNLALGLKLDKRVKNWTVPLKFLKAIHMLANHFGEHEHNFIHSAERTTLASEIDTKDLADICIIARDKEPFAAEKFFICADEIILMEVSSALEAVTGLVQMAFVLDLDYPKLPLTFEFLERFIYGMGLSDTRVKSKSGKRLLVLTAAVRETSNKFKEFETEMQEDTN